MTDAPIRVLGLGNVLMADDAAGPAAIETFNALYEVPDAVAVLDVGTPGLDLTPYLAEADLIVLVDTVKAQGTPGEIVRYDRVALLRHMPQPRLSPHDPGLKEALLSLDFASQGPRAVILIGIIPEQVTATAGLSDRVRAALEPAAHAVASELEGFGVKVTKRTPPGAARLWWEAPADPR